jgi:hypothetical protein
MHNRVRQELYQRLKKQVTSDWRLLEESPMSRTAPRLALVPTTLVQEAGRAVADSDIQVGHVSLSNLQPDIVGISFAKRKIAIGPEVTIPSDSRPQALMEAYDKKIKCYRPLTAVPQGPDTSAQDGIYVFSARKPNAINKYRRWSSLKSQTEMDIHNGM